MVRCLLIAPSGSDLGIVPEILSSVGLDPTLSLRFGAGIALATADVSRFQAAVVVLPAQRSGQVLQAVLVETGIAAGRNLPLLLIVPEHQIVPPALASVQVVRTDLRNREAIALHIGLFAKSIETPATIPVEPSVSSAGPAPLSQELADQFDARLAAIAAATTAGTRTLGGSATGESMMRRGWAIEQLVADLLSAAGARFEMEAGDADRGFDAAAFIPGQEEYLGLIVIEIKERLDRVRRVQAERQLQSYVIHARAGLGLLLYMSSNSKASTPTAPLVLSLSIAQLIRELRIRSLSTVLMDARNRAVHDS